MKLFHGLLNYGTVELPTLRCDPALRFGQNKKFKRQLSNVIAVYPGSYLLASVLLECNNRFLERQKKERRRAQDVTSILIISCVFQAHWS